MGRSLHDGGMEQAGIAVELTDRDDTIMITNHRMTFNRGPVEISVDDLQELLDAVANEMGAPIVIDRPTETVTKMVAWLRKVAAETTDENAQAQLEALADGVLEGVYEIPESAWRHSNYDSRETHSFSVGPVTLDVDMARENGWDYYQIARACDILSTVSRTEYRIASHREGLTRQCKACECWTVPKGDCHLCEPREIGELCRYCAGNGVTKHHPYGYTDEEIRCTYCKGHGRRARCTVHKKGSYCDCVDLDAVEVIG